MCVNVMWGTPVTVTVIAQVSIPTYSIYTVYKTMLLAATHKAQSGTTIANIYRLLLFAN
jgi:hypothetical protein